MKRTWFAVLMTVCLTVIGYFTFDEERTFNHQADHELYFPDLLERINSVERIEIRTHRVHFSVDRENDLWSLEQFDSYPADFSLVRSFLVGLSQLRRLEAKTDNPDKHVQLDLVGTDSSESKTVRITLSVGDGEALADLYMGRIQQSKSNPDLSEYFVRHPDQDQVWLVSGSLGLRLSALDWLNTEIVDLDRNDVREMRIQIGASPSIRVYKASASDKNFMLANLAEGNKIRHQFRINEIGEVFRKLNFIDVRRTTSWQSSAKAVAATFEDLQVAAQFGDGQFSDYAIFSAVAADDASPDVHENAARLNARWNLWAYRLSDVRVKTIHASMSQLIEAVSADDG